MVEELLVGHGRFRAEYAADESEFLLRLAAEGQRPLALFFGCSDSRVIPELLTDAAPGDLFVVRNVANRITVRDDPDTSIGAAIDYAVEQLGVREVIVCGHDGCGGVEAAFDDLPGIEPGSELAVWLQGLLPAATRAQAVDPDPQLQLRRAVEEIVLDGIANLMTYPAIAPTVEAGRIRLHGWVFSLHERTLRVYDSAQVRFFGVADFAV
jgi:carbonic anhydrase